jgi:hypothetical protein
MIRDARARLVRISPQATEIELFADVLTSRWSEYVDRREQILLGALEALGGDATTSSDVVARSTQSVQLGYSLCMLSRSIAYSSPSRIGAPRPHPSRASSTPR